MHAATASRCCSQQANQTARECAAAPSSTTPVAVGGAAFSMAGASSHVLVLTAALLITLILLVPASKAVGVSPTEATDAATVRVDVDLTAPTTPFPHYFSKCLGSGHALLTLREDWRRTVTRARAEIGVENVRFHGILDDDMVSVPNH